MFLTSFLPGHRTKFGIDVDDIRAVNPTIIYARGSALGPRGEESVKGGYDMTAFWCRAGTAATITPPGMRGMIGPPGPAYGDTISGTNLAGGIAAALLKRERTGEPSVVDVSLLGSGLWSMGHTVALTKHLGQLHGAAPAGCARVADQPAGGRLPDRRRPLHLLRHDAADQVLGRRVQAHGPRGSHRRSAVRDRRVDRREHRRGGRDSQRGDGQATAPEWSERFSTLVGPWAPVQDTLQAVEDAQIRANEYIVQAGELELVANPVQFDVSAPQTGPAPGFAEQTDEILLELGLDWDRIIELKTAGAVT